MPTLPLRHHALRKGTELTLCGHNGPIAEGGRPVDCKRCRAILDGGLGETVSKRFNFPLNPAKWAALKR